MYKKQVVFRQKNGNFLPTVAEEGEEEERERTFFFLIFVALACMAPKIGPIFYWVYKHDLLRSKNRSFIYLTFMHSTFQG